MVTQMVDASTSSHSALRLDGQGEGVLIGVSAEARVAAGERAGTVMVIDAALLAGLRSADALAYSAYNAARGRGFVSSTSDTTISAAPQEAAT